MSIESPNISREERKQSLQKAVDKSLEAIQNQLGDLKKVGTNALVIGGVIVAAYALTELLLPNTNVQQAKNTGKLAIVEDNNDDESEGESVLWAGMKGIATSLLLALAKEKLMELIEQLTEKDAKPSAE